MRVCLPGLFVLLVALLPGPVFAAKRVALLVGANEGWDEPKLRYARKDAHKLRDVLVRRGGFAEKDIVVLEDPGAGELREQLEAMKRQFVGRSGAETLFVFYYSGHADREHLHLQGAPAFSLKELLASLREVPAAQKLGIIDACQSGALLKGARLASPGFDVARKEELAVSGLALLVSSTANEPSQESKELAGSFFTHHLVSGLFGLADANGDRRVTLSEAYQHARERTAAATVHTRAGPQHPGAKIELAGYEELYLTAEDGSEAVLAFPPGWPRCFLTDRFEMRLLVEIPPGAARSLVPVPAGSYLLKCEASEELLRVARVDVRAAEHVEVSSGLRFHDKPRGDGFVKGGKPLRTVSLLPIVSGGVMASGAAFLALSKQERWRIVNFDPSHETLVDLERRSARGELYQRVGFGLIGAGLVGMGIAAGMQWMRKPEPSLTVGVGTSGASLLIQGRWP
ncbi:MAG TPA: caspase family protein [Myxococcaceae bacterium]|nr:caspase family protein [Myxococcaceae bacterium]